MSALLEALNDNRELVSVAITAILAALFGKKVVSKNTEQHLEAHSVLREIKENQVRMHQENRDDIREMRDDMKLVSDWAVRHQAIHDERERHDRDTP